MHSICNLSCSGCDVFTKVPILPFCSPQMLVEGPRLMRKPLDTAPGSTESIHKVDLMHKPKPKA